MTKKRSARVFPVGTTGRYHWPLDDQLSDGLRSCCGRAPLNPDRGLSPGEVGPFQRCQHRACRREFDLFADYGRATS